MQYSAQTCMNLSPALSRSENSISGIVVPLNGMQKISSWCRDKDIKLHLDGARLFEAVASGAGSLADYCRLFDTVALDFSKDLSAAMGAMILGNEAVITRAPTYTQKYREWNETSRRFSPLLHNVAVNEDFGVGEWGSKIAKLRAVHEKAIKVGELWERKGGKLRKLVQTNQVWMNLDALGVSAEVWNSIGEGRRLLLNGSRLVFHHQITADATDQSDFAFADLITAKD